jgi:4-hydroxy-2-oxoheptanedioate aldolase
MRGNHVRRRLKAGEPSIGTWLSLPSPEAAEYCSQLGFDWLTIDAEHNPIDIRTLAQMFAAMAATNTAPMVRIPWNSGENFKRVLDAGAWGVLAPNVRTREEAELLVRACRYPPQGVRSLGAGRFPLSFKTDPATYFQRANDEILVIVQIEHHEAIKNVDAILSVPGVDACYVGPNDFCASLGLAPSLEPPHREFHDAMDVLLKACKRHGVVPGIHCQTTETVNRRIAEGWPLVGMVNDQRFLTSAAKAARDAVKTDR